MSPPTAARGVVATGGSLLGVKSDRGGELALDGGELGSQDGDGGRQRGDGVAIGSSGGGEVRNSTYSLSYVCVGIDYRVSSLVSLQSRSGRISNNA